MQAFKGKKRKFASLGMSISHIKATFPASAKVIMPEPFKEVKDEEPDLTCIIWLFPKDLSVNTIMSFEDGLTSTIQSRLPSKMIGL